jgi:hypothetical protein
VSIFSSIGKAIGKLKIQPFKAISKVVPGGSLVAGAIGVGSKLLKRVDRKVVKSVAAGAGVAAAGAGLGAMMAGGGDSGRSGKRYRRINPGNTRALRRAVRRIEQGAKMYSKVFGIKHGSIHGAPKVKLKFGKRRAA